ncbi:MAG: hypothetical protein JWQ78_429, partial [Sediminibacterium sp.]|nr:hypothetical protein [Sediminibacterium sp.]
PAYPLPYYAFYEYYANRDVNKAKEYLDKFIATADKDPENEIFVADYLFRAARYQESLAKIKELDAAVGTATLPGLNLLYAYNYDRLADSVQSKAYLEKYFANPSSNVKPEDYELAVKVFSKFPGSEGVAAGYLEKAILNDTSKLNKINYMGQAADLYAKAKNYPEQVKWLQRQIALKGGTMGEADYYKLTSAALNSKDYAQTIALAKTYMTAFPDKPQPYAFFKRAAIASDPDTTKGTGVEYLHYLDSVYLTIDKEKYKKDIFLNLYYTLNYYINRGNMLKNNPDFKVSTSGQKTPSVEQFLAMNQKAMEVIDQMIQLYPDPADDNNKFAQNAKAGIQRQIDYYSKPQPARKTGGSAAGTSGKGK